MVEIWKRLQRKSTSYDQKSSHPQSRRSASQSNKDTSRKQKSAEKVWERAVNRRALEDVMITLRLNSTSPIADVVSDVFGVHTTSQDSSCHRNIPYRRAMYKKEAHEATL